MQRPEIPRNQTPTATPPNWSLTLPAWAQTPHPPSGAPRRGVSLAAAAKKALHPHRRRHAARRPS